MVHAVTDACAGDTSMAMIDSSARRFSSASFGSPPASDRVFRGRSSAV
jgi:hypothetical protein